MNQRNALLIAAGLTSFVLVVVGALAARLGAPATAAGQPVAASATLDPTIAALQAREAAYQAQIQQANQQLQAAYSQLQATAVPSATQPLNGPISAEQAAQIAVTYLGGGEVREVERESERGLDVFAVKMSDGTTIYVDAAAGQVAYAERREGSFEHEEGGDVEEHEREGDHHD